MTEQEFEVAKAATDAFIGGVKAASIAMRDVLQRKMAVGIITEATAMAIFEATGETLQGALDSILNAPEAPEAE